MNFAQSQWLWKCYATHVVMVLAGKCMNRGLGIVMTYFGMLVTVRCIAWRFERTWAYAKANDGVARESFEMGLKEYTAMCVLNSIPTFLLRYSYVFVYAAIFGYEGGPELGTRWLVLEFFAGFAAWAGFMVFNQWVRFFWLWHKVLHKDPLLYRCIHKWHHLHKPATPLSSGSEELLEWTPQYCNFCCMNPFNSALTLIFDPIDVEGHNSVGWDQAVPAEMESELKYPHKPGMEYTPVDMPPIHRHVKHHLTPECNFGLMDDDEVMNTAKPVLSADLAYLQKCVGAEAPDPMPRDLKAFQRVISSRFMGMTQHEFALMPVLIWIGGMIAHAGGWWVL